MIYFFITFLQSLIFGFITAYIANSKNRNAISWFFISFLFGVIGLIILLILDNLSENKDNTNEFIKEIGNNKLEIICNNCKNTFVMNKDILQDVDVIICSKCKHEINLKATDDNKEEVNEDNNILHLIDKTEDENFIIAKCPNCQEELNFSKNTLEDNQVLECPYCKGKIKID